MRYQFFKKFMCYITLAAFLASGVTPAYAQGVVTVLDLPKPGAMVNVSASFVPPILKGINVDVKQPFKFDFILDTGNSGLDADTVQDEASKLIRYFLASLTIPEKDLWVNLSPYEKDRIIHDDLGLTEMGRDMLAQDYILKQITASLIYPENETGKAFWDKVYAKAFALYGTTDIPVDTFNKVWIMPGEAEVYENGTKAFVTKATMKVMLESDYLAMSNVEAPQGSTLSPANAEVKDILRDVVVPVLEKEVNEGQNFSQLRQIYYSLILAKWYKDTLKDSILNKKYSDQNKVQGVDLEDRDVKQKIYARYLQAFKTGVFNYVKEEQALNSAELIPRKYFSGGVDLAQKIDLKKIFSLPANAVRGFVGRILRVGGSFDPAKNIVSGTELFSLEDAADDPFEEAPPQGLRFFTKDRGLKDYLQVLSFISPSLRKAFEDHLFNTYKVKGEDFVYVEEGAGFGQALNDLRKLLGKKALLLGVDIKDWVKDPKALKETLEPLDKMIKDGVASAQAIKEKYIAQITNPGYEFVLGDITDVKFPKAADLVTSFYVLQYLDDPLAAVANAFNQLSPDGMLVMHLLLPSSDHGIYDLYESLAQDMRDKGVSFEVYPGEPSGEYLDVIFVARRVGNKKISFDLGSNKKIRIMMGKNGLPFDINVITYYEKAGIDPVRVTDSAENSSPVDKLTPETLLSFADHGLNRLNDTADMEKYGKGAKRFGIKAVVNTGEQIKGPLVYFFNIDERHKDVAKMRFGEESDKHLGYELQAVKMPDGTVGIVGVVMRSQLTDGRDVPAEDKARGKAILLGAVVKENIIDDSDDISKELYVDHYKDPLHQQQLADFVVNMTPPVINGDASFDNKYKIEVINQQFSIALANHPDELKKYLRAFETGRLPVEGFEQDIQKELLEHFLRVRNDLGVLIDVEHPQGRPLWQVDAQGKGRILKNGKALTQKEASAIRHYLFGIFNAVQGFLELALMEPSEYQHLFIDIMHRFYNEAQSVIDLADLAGRPNNDIVAALDQRLKRGAPLTIRGLEQFLKKRASGFDHIAQVLLEYMSKEAGFNVGSESFGTAFHEALKNAVIWGNHAEENAPVTLNWGVTQGEFWVEVIDQGAPFALDQQELAPAGIDDHYYSGKQGVSQLMWRYLSLKTKQANGDGKIGYAVDGGKAVRLEFIDRAQEKAPTQGGIDLNADRMDLRRTGQRSEFDWGMSAAELENVQINGLSPVIIQITPVQDLPAFLAGISSCRKITCKI